MPSSDCKCKGEHAIWCPKNPVYHLVSTVNAPLPPEDVETFDPELLALDAAKEKMRAVYGFENIDSKAKSDVQRMLADLWLAGYLVGTMRASK